MTGRSRRTILCGTAGLLALSAGCLDEAGVSDAGNGNGNESEPNGDPGTSGNGDENGESDDGNASTEDSGETIDSVSYSYPASADSEPDAALLIDADGVADWIDERELEAEDVASFVDEIDFTESVVVAVEADAPNLCYELVLEDYELEDDGEQTDDSDETDAALELEAVVKDVVNDDSETEMACAPQEIVVGQLIRAPIADDPSVSVSIVDRHGTERGIGIAADSASESASDGESASESESDA